MRLGAAVVKQHAVAFLDIVSQKVAGLEVPHAVPLRLAVHDPAHHAADRLSAQRGGGQKDEECKREMALPRRKPPSADVAFSGEVKKDALVEVFKPSMETPDGPYYCDPKTKKPVSKEAFNGRYVCGPVQ